MCWRLQEAHLGSVPAGILRAEVLEGRGSASASQREPGCSWVPVWADDSCPTCRRQELVRRQDRLMSRPQPAFESMSGSACLGLLHCVLTLSCADTKGFDFLAM